MTENELSVTTNMSPHLIIGMHEIVLTKMAMNPKWLTNPKLVVINLAAMHL